MAKNKKKTTTTSNDEELKEGSENTTENNLEEQSNDVVDVNSNNSENSNTMSTDVKTDDQIYEEIQNAKPRPKYKRLFDLNDNAMKDGGDKSQLRFLNLNVVNGRKSSTRKISYGEIKLSQAYAMKKYKCTHMFELTEEQLKFIRDKPLNYFANKKYLA